MGCYPEGVVKRVGRSDRRVGGGQAWFAGLCAGLLYAILFVLSFPPYDVWPLCFLCVIPLVIAAVTVRLRGRLFLAVWIASTIGFLWIERWMVDVTVVGYPLLCIYLGFYPALFTYLLSRLRSGCSAGVRCRLPNVLLVPILWTGIEFFRGDFFMEGYPWFLIGHPAIGLPVLCQSADLFGAYFVSFLTGMTAGVFLDLFMMLKEGGGRERRRFLKRSLMIYFAVQFVNVGYGVMRLRDTPSVGDAGVRTVTVGAIQSNVLQSNKMGWTSEAEYYDFGKMVKWTKEAAKWAKGHGEEIDLFVWPETMCPGYAFTDKARERIGEFEKKSGYMVSGIAGVSGLYYDNTLSELAKTLDRPIIVGAAVDEGFDPQLKEETNASGEKVAWIILKHDRRFNSAVLYDADGQRSATRYDKIRLTPFGEEIPYAHYWPWLEQKMLSLGAKGMAFDLSSGKQAKRLTVRTTGGDDSHNENGQSKKAMTVRVGTPICFESSVASVCRELVGGGDEHGDGRADILINMTNDGWFGSDRGGRLQHFQIGRFRAIENRVPVIRSANTGVSGAIDSAGRIVQAGPNVPEGVAPAWSEGAMVANVALDGRSTLFGLVGNVFGWMMMGLTIVLGVLSYLGGGRHESMTGNSFGKGIAL